LFIDAEESRAASYQGERRVPFAFNLKYLAGQPQAGRVGQIRIGQYSQTRGTFKDNSMGDAMICEIIKIESAALMIRMEGRVGSRRKVGWGKDDHGRCANRGGWLNLAINKPDRSR